MIDKYSDKVPFQSARISAEARRLVSTIATENNYRGETKVLEMIIIAKLAKEQKIGTHKLLPDFPYMDLFDLLIDQFKE